MAGTTFNYRGRLGLTSLVCFPCRYTTKAMHGANVHGRRCPNCRVTLRDCGKHFKAPKRTDDARWRVIEALHDRSPVKDGAPHAPGRTRIAEWAVQSELVSLLRKPSRTTRRLQALGIGMR